MYAFRHIPTQKWVNIVRNDLCQEFEIYGFMLSVDLVDDLKNASVYTNFKILEEDIKDSFYQNKNNYFKDNFLELELISL